MGEPPKLGLVPARAFPDNLMHTLSPPHNPTTSSILRTSLFRLAFVYWALIIMIPIANEDMRRI